MPDRFESNRRNIKPGLLCTIIDDIRNVYATSGSNRHTWFKLIT